MDDVLLRGCMLKNSHHVVGVVMYTGPESRIQKNASATPIKVGACGVLCGACRHMMRPATYK